MKAVAAISEQKSGLNETDKTVIRIAVYTLGSLALGTGFFFLGRHIYRSHRQKRAAKQILTDNSPENYATRMQKALFDGWWANVDRIRQMFNEIPSKEFFKEVATQYGKVNRKPDTQLFLDLRSELTDQEFTEMTNILAAKPARTGQKATFDMKAAAAMAKRIKSAFDYTWMKMDGTDKKALKQALLDIPSLRGFAMVMVAYKQLYKTDLTSDLDKELDAFDFSWKEIVYTKPKY